MNNPFPQDVDLTFHTVMSQQPFSSMTFQDPGGYVYHIFFAQFICYTMRDTINMFISWIEICVLLLCILFTLLENASEPTYQMTFVNS